MKSFCWIILVLVSWLGNVADLNTAWAAPPGTWRNAEFKTPGRLRPRVNFWINVFTRYSKYDSIFHHRNRPDIIFEVLNFGQEAKKLTAYKFARYRKKKEQDLTKRIKAAFQNLSKGRSPRSSLEKELVRVMAPLPGGTKKYQEVVKGKLIRTQSGIKEKYAEAIKRSGRYMHIIEKIFVQEQQLPVELTRLPFIESSFDYNANSSVGAAGIWQFMPRTGRLYMKVNYIVDERRDVISSTRGAAKYLKNAYRELGNWPLALTSYNHGIAGVKRRMKKIGSKNIVDAIEHPSQQVFGFASANFYPEFLAALDVYDDYQRYFPTVVPEPPLRVSEYKLPHSFSVKYLMRKLGIKEEVLKKYNYALSKNVWRGYNRIPKGYHLKIPPAYETLLSQLKVSEPSTVSASAVYGGIVYKVRRGDTLTRIARRYGVSIAHLKKLNGLRSDRVYVGQNLKVKERENKPNLSTTRLPAEYKVRSGDSLYSIGRRYGASAKQVMYYYGLTSSRIKIGQRLKTKHKPATKTSTARTGNIYTVRRGDTLSKIARRYGMSVSQLKQLNGLRSDRVYVGQKLKVKGRSSKSSLSTAGLPAEYKVRSGDSLYLIGKRYGASAKQVMNFYGLASSRIKIGQRLRAKQGSSSASRKDTYTVRRGDSLWSISKKFKVSIKRLQYLNRLSGSKVKIGQKLRLQ